MGLAILPPHVNASVEAFTAERRPGAGGAGARTGHAIRIGLSQVKGLTRHAIRSILEARQQRGPYRTLDDFLDRVILDGRDAESLIRCGALDGLGASRPNLLWALKRRVAARRRRPGSRGTAGFLPPACEVPRLPEYEAREKRLAELECLDLTVDAHLISLYDLNRDDLLPARDLDQHAGRVVTLAGWLVHSKRTRTVKNEFMKFLMLEDATAPFEVTLFPKVYRRFGPLLVDRGPYLVKGRVEREGDCITLTALWLGRVGEGPVFLRSGVAPPGK